MKQGSGQTEEVAGSGEPGSDGLRRFFKIHSSVATTQAAGGFPKASTPKNGIEHLATTAALDCLRNCAARETGCLRCLRCWLSGSDAKHGVGQVRWWHAHVGTKLAPAGSKMGCVGGKLVERRGSCSLSPNGEKLCEGAEKAAVRRWTSVGVLSEQHWSWRDVLSHWRWCDVLDRRCWRDVHSRAWVQRMTR